MSNDHMIEEPGEAAQRRRQVVLIALTFLLFLIQGVALAAAERIQAGAIRAVDVAQIAAPLLVVAGLLRGLFTAPRYIGREAREAAVDELTVENRHRALAFGFVAAAVACALLTLLAAFGRVSAVEAAHGALAIVMAATTFRFVWLERRGSGESD